MAGKMNKWTRFHHCSLLVINPCNNSDKQSSLLMGEYRSLLASPVYVFRATNICSILPSGVTKKASAPDSSYCCVSRTNAGRYPIRRRRQFSRVATKNAFLATSPSLKARRRSRNTGRFSTITKRYSTTRARRRPRQLFFAYTEQPNRAACSSHSYFATPAGSALKIVVRENIASLRATDERLLLGCGANMIIPGTPRFHAV